MNILFISRFTPYDDIGHAGGKTFNYYLKKLADADGDGIRVVSFCSENNRKKIDLENYGIDDSVLYISDNKIDKIKRRIPDLIKIPFQPKQCYVLFGSIMRKMMINKLIYIKKEGYIPDVIILEWTQILMIAHEIKAIFPNIPIAVSEHDVTFLSYQRKWEHAKGVLGKKVNKMLYEAMKAKELYEISACDLVYTQSEKDSNLLVGNGVPQEKVFTITPYYETFSEVSSKHNTKDIIFYGAMDRAENYKSAIWFIDHVMPELTKWNIRFIVIGNRPNKSLLKRKAANIIITGFVAAEELRGYFSNCLCMAAPLVIGGGIKVKVLEAMSAGVVVLTNHIGIEGIPAKDNESYIFCNTPEEYINVVRKILDHRLDVKKIGENARTLVSNIFSQNRSFEYWRKRIHELGVKN